MPLFKQAEITRQVESYHTLGVWHSARGNIFVAFCVLMAMTFAAAFLGAFSLAAPIVAALIYLPLSYLASRGKKGLMVVIMVLYTIDVFATIVLYKLPLSFIGWIIVMLITYKAYVVEKARGDMQASLPTPPTPPQAAA